MKKRFLIQSQGKPPVGLPVNFLQEASSPSNWFNAEHAYETFEEAALICEKLIKAGNYKAEEARIVEVVGTFSSDVSVTVNKAKETEVVVVPEMTFNDLLNSRVRT